MQQESEGITERQEYERKGDRNQTYVADQSKEMTVYGRHFMSKPPVIFYSQEKKMIINVLWSGISIQSVPNNSQNLEVIKYKDIISVHLSPDKDNEVIIVYNNRLVPAGKNPQTQYNFKSDDRHLFLADYYRGIDTYHAYMGIKQIPNSSINLTFVSIAASYIVDKQTKSYFESRLTCFNSHLTIEIMRPTFLSDKKFEQLRSSMFYTNSKSHSQQQKQQEQMEGNSEGQKSNVQSSTSQSAKWKTNFNGNIKDINFPLVIAICRHFIQLDKQSRQQECLLIGLLKKKIKNYMKFLENPTHQFRVKEQKQKTKNIQEFQQKMNTNMLKLSNFCFKIIGSSNQKNQNTVLVVKYRDIVRIQKKSNGFQINLSKPSLSMAFYLNDLNQVSGFVNRIQKNSKESTKLEVSVTSTLQEEIHHVVKFNEKEMDVDFALYAGRIMYSRAHKRYCILSIGKGGIFEVDQHDGEVYEQYDLKYLKDMVRQEQTGSVRNTLKLIFFNGQEVEYVFEPYQRDLFIVEICTNINMYYDMASPCRRCLDMIHSRTPNYQLEINGWKMDGGTPERDQDVDSELMKNILHAKGEDAFFSALREFNVNCNLKKTTDADLKLYHHIISVLARYLSYFDDHDLLFFLKHMKFVKTIPQQPRLSVNGKQCSQLSLIKQIESADSTSNNFNHSTGTTNKTRRNSQESMLQHEHEHYEKFINLQRDALKKQVDEEYSSHLDHRAAHLKSGEGTQDQLENDIMSEGSDDIFEYEQSPMTRKHNQQQLKGLTPQAQLFSNSSSNQPVVSPFEIDTTQKNKNEDVHKQHSPNIHPYNREGLGISQRFRFEVESPDHINQKLNESNKDLKKLFQLASFLEYSLQEYELMHQIRNKSVAMLKKLTKTHVSMPNDNSQQAQLKLNAESVETLLLKIEEMLKCLTIFQNCKKFFEDKTIKQEKLKEFKNILQLLSNPDPLIVYQTSQLFKRVGFYHNNMMQKAETDNKNFLLDSRFNILDRVFYQISNYTLIKRPLSQYTFMIRIYSMFSIINTLFQARIESTAPVHRQAIIYHLQSPVFFAAVSRILRYNSFSLIVNSINLMNALYYFSTENKQFINMILLNSTMLLFLIHIVIQDIYSSKQLKDIGFNLLFSLLNQRSQACYVIMNVFPKPLFKMQKTESIFVDQWTKQEWYNFFFTEIQKDIKLPHYFWLKQNLKNLDEALLKEDKIFLHQQIFTVFKRINHVCDLQQFFPYLFRKDGNFSRAMELTPPQSSTTLMSSQVKGNPQEVAQANVTPQEAELINQIKELQKEIFTKLFWNIDDFKVEYENVNEQFLCGRYYIKQLIINNKRLQFDFVDAKNQLMEKEIKELWENLVSNLMNQQNKEKQALCVRMMTILYKEYSKVIKITNILPYLVHISNLHEFQVVQYSLVQLILTVLNSDDAQAKQFHCRTLIDCNGIQQLLNIICQRISLQDDQTEIPYGADATILKLPEVRHRGDENLYVIFMCLKMISGCIQMHSHIFRKREVYPLTKPQKVCFEKRNWRIIQNILLLRSDQNPQEISPQSIVRNEYLKLVYDYLMNDYMLHINGFCELLVDQLNENTMKLTFTIMKALFYRLPDAKIILEEIINGNGLQKKHIEVYPFFKFFPIQLLLILLNDQNEEESGGLRPDSATIPSGITNHHSQQPTSSSSSSSSHQNNIPKDYGVEMASNSFKADNQERHDLIWNKSMKSHLKEKVGAFLQKYRESVCDFYTNNFRPDKLKMSDYRIVTEEKINSYPILLESFPETIYYPQLKNEITSCQIFLRLWAKYKNDETDNFGLPTQFSEKTVLKIQQYSFQPDIFKVLNDNTSSAMKNLLHVLKAQSKIFKNRIQVNSVYPYNHILSILQTCTKIVKDSIDDPSQLEDLDESALEDQQAPSSPLLSQNKRNSFRKNSQADLAPSSPSRASLFQARRLSQTSVGSSSNLDLSFSTPLTDCLQTTFNQYIKATLKVIYHSLRERKNLEAFTEKMTGIECILYTLSNIIIQIQIKHLNRQDIKNYFDDISVSYSEIKIINYSILILQEIYDTKKIKLNHLAQQKRNDMCLLIQRAQKITITYFHTFLEKFTGSLNSNVKEKYGNTLSLPIKSKSKENKQPQPTLVNSQSTTSLLTVSTNLTSSQTVPANSPNPQYNVLLDKLYNVDPDNIMSYSNVIVEKCFKATRQLNQTIAVFVLSLSKNVYFLESLIRGGCVWRSIEIILTKSKTFNTLQNNEKKYNTENLDDITKLYSKMLYYIIENCEFIKSFEQNGAQTMSLSLKPVQMGIDNVKDEESEASFSNYGENGKNNSQQDEGKKPVSSNSLTKQDQKSQLQNNDSSTSLTETPKSKIKGNWRNNIGGADQEILEEEQSRSDERSSAAQSQRYNLSMYSKSNEITNTSNIPTVKIHEGQEDDEGDVSEISSPSRKKRKDEEEKEYLFYNMQLLREIGPLGRDKLMFFVNQFLIALIRNVDNHLLKYLKEKRYEQFIRKINSNIELPDFIWNQISRDKLDQNLKQQIININTSLGKIFLDKLLEHQGIIQLEDNHLPGTSPSKDNQHDISPMNQTELQICGIYLRVFNDSDNFEVTNPQTFQQEIFNQMKLNVDKIQEILKEQAPNGVYDILAINQLFPTEIKAVKECVKATLSLLTRYNVSYIILNPDNIKTFYQILKLEMDYQVNLSAFKLQVAKILQELAGNAQGGIVLMESKIFIKYIIFNFLDCNAISTQILSQFLTAVQKLARCRENLEGLVKERIVAVLLLNMLKKEYLKQALRVQIVEVLNEINIDNELFINYVSDKFPPRIVQKCFAERQQKPSVEIIEIFETVSVTSSDLLWTGLMRIEAILILEEEIKLYLKKQDEKLLPLIPQYPEYQNEIQCSQIMLRIFNLAPSYTKFPELTSLSHIYSKNDPDTYFSYAEVLLENLIDLSEKLKNQFIKLQEENIAKNKESLTNVIDENQLNDAPVDDPALQEFDRVSISYITALTSLMFCIEHIILQEKRHIKEQYFKGICNQFSILSENKSHSHLKSTVLQIAYLLKDQPNIHRVFAENKLYVHIAQALNYSLDSPQEQDCLTLSKLKKHFSKHFQLDIFTPKCEVLNLFLNTIVEQIIILNLLIKLIRDKDTHDRKLTIEQNLNYCLPAISKLLESIDEDNAFMKSYIIGYSAEMLKSGYFLEEISAVIDQTTFSSKQLAASKNIHCEQNINKIINNIKWVNLWRTCVVNYDINNSLSEQQQRLFQDKYGELFFSLPIQSEFSIQTLPFPPQVKEHMQFVIIDYLMRQQELEDFKSVYEKENSLKKSASMIMTESVHQQFN